jgi:acyl carrier protein
MERQEIFDTLAKLIREKIAPNRQVEISVGVSLDELGLDSLDKVELVMMVEEEFSICLSDEAADSIKIVGDAVMVIHDALELQKNQ